MYSQYSMMIDKHVNYIEMFKATSFRRFLSFLNLLYSVYTTKHWEISKISYKNELRKLKNLLKLDALNF